MRQQSHIATTCCVVAVLGSATLSAQQPPATSSPRPAAAAAQADPWSLKPFLRLFGDTGRDRITTPLEFAAPRPESRVICGIKVLPADPTIDPKFATPLRDTRTRFSILTVPVLCP
jgi:hypothetical protein